MIHIAYRLTDSEPHVRGNLKYNPNGSYGDQGQYNATHHIGTEDSPLRC
jgi:hypothetical protein